MEYMMQNDLLEHIGRKIKFYRVKRKLTVTQLARMVHLSPSAISKYSYCGSSGCDSKSTA